MSGFQFFFSDTSRGKDSWCNTLVLLRGSVCVSMPQLHGTHPAMLLSLPLTVAIQCVADTSIKIIAPKLTILYFDNSGLAGLH